MSVTSGEQLLATELRQIHSAEKLLSRALPRLSKAVTSETLRQKLNERLEEGREILESVERELEQLEVSVGRRKNVAVDGLLEDASQLAEEIEAEELLDVALIGAIQKVQHYCIAAWGTTAAFGRALEQDSLVEAMERALENGKRFDEELTEVAEEEVNPALFDAREEEEEVESQPRSRSQRSRSEEREGGGRSGGKASGGRASAQRNGRSSKAGRESSQSLKEREYRDRNGQIRHHTKSYMERHGRK